MTHLRVPALPSVLKANFTIIAFRVVEFVIRHDHEQIILSQINNLKVKFPLIPIPFPLKCLILKCNSLSLFRNTSTFICSFPHLIPLYLPFLLPLTFLPYMFLPQMVLAGPGGLSPVPHTHPPAEALTGMQKLCSSLCSNSVGSRNSDSRPTSPFRHHFLPHSQGKAPNSRHSAAPSKATCHLHRALGRPPLLISSVMQDPSPFITG